MSINERSSLDVSRMKKKLNQTRDYRFGYFAAANSLILRSLAPLLLANTTQDYATVSSSSVRPRNTNSQKISILETLNIRARVLG